MTEPTVARPDIDPVLKMLLDTFPVTFTAADGVEVARARLRQLKTPRSCCRSYGSRNGPLATTGSPTFRSASTGRRSFATTCPWLSTTTVAAGRSAVWTPTTPSPAPTPSARRPSWCPSTTGTPEHPYPAGIDDSWAALRWVGENAAELGGDPSRIAVAGDSAGGNISAVMAQLARDVGGPPLVFQLLWYPTTMADLSLPSFTENADAPILDRDVIDAFLAWYVPGLDISDHTMLPTTLAPGNADLSGLPPAFIGTAEHDPLRDDGACYAELLTAAGVSVELSNEPTMVHGYVNFALVVPAAAEATGRGLAALKRALHA